LFFDVRTSAENEAYLREAIHHELFHMIDHRDDGTLEDWNWESLNGNQFRYRNEAVDEGFKPPSLEVDPNLGGFLNTYSMTAVQEDKAEIFAHLVVDGNEMEGLADRDPVIRAKVTRMKQILSRFCPDVGEGFWDAAKRIPRPTIWPHQVSQDAGAIGAGAESGKRRSDGISAYEWYAAAAVLATAALACWRHRSPSRDLKRTSGLEDTRNRDWEIQNNQGKEKVSG
jgi:hypothetical protein